MKFSYKAGGAVLCPNTSHPTQAEAGIDKQTFSERTVYKTAYKAMKITCLILLVGCLQLSAAGYGQKVTIVDKNLTMQQVFEKIEDQTTYGVFFEQKLVQSLKPVDLVEKEVTVEEVLKKCIELQTIPLAYSIVGNTISIYRRSDNKGQVRQPTPPATIDLKGRVTDSSGAPLSGAVIQVEGSKKSVTADENGNFELKNVDVSSTIVVSFVGYETKRIPINGRSDLELRLRIVNKMLATAFFSYNNGLQIISPDRMTGSYFEVDSAVFNRRVSSDPLSRMEGVVPGLNVNRNVNYANNPNGIDISIRGYSTLFSNAQPLIVLDNFPYDGNFNNLNPNDIESITVLKDAAAASIWGVRSGNGVVVITTKKGRRNQKPTVDFNYNFTSSDKPDLFYNPNFIASKDFIGIEQSLFTQGYYDAQLSNATQPPVSPVVQLLSDERAGLVSASNVASQIASYQNKDIRSDMKKYLYRRGALGQYSLSVRGGSAYSDYFVSGGFDQNNASSVGNSNNRITLQSKFNFYPIKHLTVSAGMNYFQTNAVNNSPISNISTDGQYATNIYPYAQLADQNGNPLPIVKDYNLSWINSMSGQPGYLNWNYVPLNELKYAANTSKQVENLFTLCAKYDILPGLNLEAKYQYESSKTDQENYYSDSTYYARNLINEFYNASTQQYIIPVGGIDKRSSTDLTSYHGRVQANYNKTFDQHKVTFLAGAEINQILTNNSSPSTTYGYSSDNGSFQTVNFSQYYRVYPAGNYLKVPNNQGYSTLTNRYVSYFSNIAYVFRDRYVATGSVRVDKSNLFGVNTNQKSVPLYSMGIAWNMNKEDFYRLRWLPYSKLFITYGYNGNVNTSATAVTTFQQVNGSYVYGLPYAIVNSPGNPSLRWERDRMINFGWQFSSKNNFITGDLQYFLKKGIDLFALAPLPPSVFSGYFFGNTANSKGHGFDGMVNANWISRQKFRFSTKFSYSYALDKVTKYAYQSTGFLAATADGTQISPVAGRPIFSIYAYKFGGLTHDTGDPQGFIGGKASTDYANIIRNANNVDSLSFVGSARPTSYGFVTNTFTYGSLSLSFNIIYKLGYYFKRNTISYVGLFSGWGMNKDYYKRWQNPGDELRTNVPSMPTLAANADPNRDGFFSNSTAVVEKGDHVRFQDVSLSYDFGNTSFFKAKMYHLQVYSYINNIGLLWRANRDHLDPDIFSNALPAPRTYSIGIRAGF